MRGLVQYIRSLFCRHEFEEVGTVRIFSSFDDGRVVENRKTFFCRKCGYGRRVVL